ncbi:FAD-dependent pyridine nucleotide-disulphide oxidoreductase [Beutenbergia cavernae DSM 12333]|uniref:FAD-dependent pyridine nucleotide-disulphide oxidoreductase n=1 Tax=Beutenbergia cavernae (strain ATCC BAA-8 / DSM 12333 / CCUG 43141 / JCM 11478 / NBRC 16432 / NCIMB 13614 / HKI 0122) TaxID=471853 RepID=C5BYE5_BEUC1|nr:FAD-dependent oxidoreductase [Beutenbergia cavernae]ACQ81045.1 FAD-dependent pyridine nucleotide-disulphide oxidoreductase [Beutenbergia cavernae DSM 12333]
MSGAATTTPEPLRVVVVGNGMVGSRLAADLLARTDQVDVTVLGAEEYAPYNRVLLSDVVAGRRDLADLALPEAHERAHVRLGAEVIAIDRSTRTVLTAGAAYPYDALVLATGAQARIPDVPGLESALPAGVRALRTLDDARDVVAATLSSRCAVVVGGGVLGVEAACGLARRGLDVTLVHPGPTPMERQLDAAAGAVLERSLGELGVTTVTGAATRAVRAGGGRVQSVVVEGVAPDGEGRRAWDVRADLVVLACGTTPETRLASSAGLSVARGVVVGPDLASPDDPHVFAIGDCAQPPEGGTGLIAQGWDQARRLATALADLAGAAEVGPGASRAASRGPVSRGPASPDRPSMAWRLGTRVVVRTLEEPGARGTDVVRVKAPGLDVVTMGVCGGAAREPGQRSVALSDPASGRHVEVVVADGLLVGATCVGAPDVGADLASAYTRRTPVPADPAHLLLRPVAASTAPVSSPEHMPDAARVCTCNGVTKGDVAACVRSGARSVEDVARATRATTGCGTCRDAVCGLVEFLADRALTTAATFA